MPNPENLIGHEFTSEQNREEAAKNGKKGGKASARARRERKAMREAFQELLKLPMKDEDLTEGIQALSDLKGANITVQEAIAFAQIRKAIKGDTTAAAFVRDTSGEKPAEKLEVNADIEKSTAELRELIDRKKHAAN